MLEADIILAGGTILTLDDSDSRIYNGALAVQGNTIIAVGSSDDIRRLYTARKFIDTTNCIVMPGLVNCHTHAAMTCFRGLADDLELMEWLNNFIFPAEARNASPDLAYWGSLLACAEMVRSGTTTFSDMYIFEDETAQAARSAKMRCLLGEVLFDFPSPNVKSPEEGFAYTKKLIKKWASDPLVNIMVEPHSLYTCSADLLVMSNKIADEYNVPLALHLLENQEERDQLYAKLGIKATSYLRELGLLHESFFAFHCVFMDDEDIRIFADHGCKVVHNPQSNMKLASGVAPVVSMLRAGLTVGLGTDGCASNNNLDMIEEMDSASKLGKSFLFDSRAMSARTVLHMATRDGARVLGMQDHIGILREGMKADIIVIDLDKPHLTPIYDEYSAIVYCAKGSDVIHVIINGDIIMEHGLLLTINEYETMTEVGRIALKIKESMG